MDNETAIANTSRLIIVVGAMTMMVVVFTAVGFALGPVVADEAGREKLDVLRLVALALPLLELGMLAQIWMVISRRMQAAEDVPARLAIYRGRTIICVALLEGPALLAAVCVLLLGFSWHVIPALVIFALGIAALMPTPGRVRAAAGVKSDQYS